MYLIPGTLYIVSCNFVSCSGILFQYLDNFMLYHVRFVLWPFIVGGRGACGEAVVPAHAAAEVESCASQDRRFCSRRAGRF